MGPEGSRVESRKEGEGRGIKGILELALALPLLTPEVSAPV
jgi:hypothetical protein